MPKKELPSEDNQQIEHLMSVMQRMVRQGDVSEYQSIVNIIKNWKDKADPAASGTAHASVQHELLKQFG